MLMLKEESCDVLDLEVTIGGGKKKSCWGRVCDVCHSLPCRVYCGVDMAYLCAACDGRMHAAAGGTTHERVLVCEACESAPASVVCKADAASLCASCDSDIHSANPLAQRHHRVPILPIPAALYGPPAPADPCRRRICHDEPEENGFLAQDAEETTIDEDEDEAASWLLLNPNPVKNNNAIKGGGEIVDAYLELAEFDDQYSIDQDHHHQQQQHYSVPQSYGGGESFAPNHKNFQLQGIEYESFSTGYGYYPASISQTVSVSSMDVGVVPESTMSDGSIFSGAPVQMPQQLSQMDREARVLRYREKKKTRKFEKTIRYASRKAYAEVRPRIKGRFAKRTDADTEIDQMLFAPLMAESGYGIVPSF